MNKTQYVVYWTSNGSTSNSIKLDDLGQALKYTEALRKEAAKNNYSFITMVSENVNLVGQQGVLGVEDGILPDGNKYEYTKRDALSQRLKADPPIGTDNVEVILDDE